MLFCSRHLTQEARLVVACLALVTGMCLDPISLGDVSFPANSERFLGPPPLLPHLCPVCVL